MYSALNALHSLVDKSKINTLVELNACHDPLATADMFGRNSLDRMLGYFSLIGLLLCHSLLSDYYSAIRVVENVDFDRLSHNVPARPGSRLSADHVLLRELRVHDDAPFCGRNSRHFDHPGVLATHSPTASQSSRVSAGHDREADRSIVRAVEHSSGRVSVTRRRIDHGRTAGEYVDSTAKMLRGEVEEFEIAFRFASPTFLSCTNVLSMAADAGDKITRHEPWRHQLNVFMENIRQLVPVMEVRSYLKLYMSMPISKLAKYMDITESELLIKMEAYKRKMHSVSPAGEHGSDVDFYIDKVSGETRTRTEWQLCGECRT